MSRRRSAERVERRFRWWPVLAVAMLFAVHPLLPEIEARSRWQLGWGIVAVALLLVASLYGARRRGMGLVTRWRLGGAQKWLAMHVFAGFSLVAALWLHTGFRLPIGMFSLALWALTLAAVASGLLGSALQWWVPRLLSSGLSVEVLFDRIPALVEDVRQQVEGVVADCGEPIRRLYERRYASRFGAPRRRLVYLFDVTGGLRAEQRELDYLRRFLGEEEKASLDRLAQLLRTKLELDAHYTLQQVLRSWPLLHVPLAVLLIAMVALHVATVLFY